MAVSEKFRYRDHFGVFIACILCGILISGGLFVPYLNIAALALATIYIAMFDEENEICFLAFLVAFAPIFKINLYSFTLYNGLVVIAILKAFFTKGGSGNNRFSVLFLLLAFYTLLFGFRKDIMDCISFLSYILLAGVLFNPARNSYSLHKIVSFTSLGVVLSSIVSLNRNRIPRLAAYLNDATIRLAQGVHYNRFAGLESNPNYYTMMISICLAALVVLFIQGKTGILDYIFMGALCAFALMSVSNSFLVSLAIIVIAFLGTGSVSANKKIIGVLLFGVIGIVVVANLNQSTIATLLFRWNFSVESANTSDLTTGRSTLWMRYLQYLLGDFFALLFGTGIGAQNLGVGASHNYYLDILYHLGVIGSFIYIKSLLSIFSTKYCHFRKPALYQYIPFVVFFARGFARNLIMSEQLPFMLILCAIAACDGNMWYDLDVEDNHFDLE